MQNPTPMTLDNMRANGVRTLAAWRPAADRTPPHCALPALVQQQIDLRHCARSA
jgi:hypothetical protein